MISVSTGQRSIQSVDGEYRERQERIEEALKKRGIKDPNEYPDLWSWYGKWSSGDLPSYQSRRMHITGLYTSLIERVKQGSILKGAAVFEEPTGWEKVDRGLTEIRKRLEEASTEEQFQAVGLLCREILISLAQTVYNPSRHPPLDGIKPSSSDAKRMLEAYLTAELGGDANKVARQHAKAAFELANELQHKRTANFRQAALCAEATTAVVNLIAIMSGKRDP